ncbi:cysteine--tRNA ligase [Candidatus Shapirobacteria bacterium CG2_30_35_20]|uniref:Cysteine--tRNA ligase n=1 Tax=Candidatus Shapirobacteria bacterium CG2_30_35_20 TaxID=1805376 RepID=A0A1J5I3U6_9BACT|nr:MAG: cysteine--tRNA ligase [Candidatus Shapirobacteria bacterium CG2_30_35_20]
MQKIFLYNTLTRKKEELKPITEGKIGMYSCGPTVYSSPHIGNMEAYIIWDILVRVLEYIGYDVKQVINITDVGHLVADSDDGEDKMEKGSRMSGMSAWDLAKKYEAEFVDNFKMLNIKLPWKMPRVTDNMSEQIELLKKIEANGFTYKISDGIYFDTQKFPGYGDFAHLNLDKIKDGISSDMNPEKKNQTDFALWKFSPSASSGQARRQMEWDSPWGVGFPGWHLECTAISTKFLGNPFDIHTGGEDHIAIHHTNEIAQGYGAFGKQTANVWIHNAFITFAGAKISKSTGGLYTVNELKDMGFDPLAYRFMILGAHYKNGLSFSIDSLKVAQTSLNKLNSFVAEIEKEGIIDEKYKAEFIEKIADELAMPEAMAIVWKLTKDEKISDADKKATLLDFDKVLGLNLGTVIKEEIPEEIIKLAQERTEAKEAKDWVRADILRDKIKTLGYLVEDFKNDCKIRKLVLS